MSPVDRPSENLAVRNTMSNETTIGIPPFFVHPFFALSAPPFPRQPSYPKSCFSGTSDLIFLVEKRQPPGAGFCELFWMGSPHRKKREILFFWRTKEGEDWARIAIEVAICKRVCLFLLAVRSSFFFFGWSLLLTAIRLGLLNKRLKFGLVFFCSRWKIGLVCFTYGSPLSRIRFGLFCLRFPHRRLKRP